MSLFIRSLICLLIISSQLALNYSGVTAKTILQNNSAKLSSHALPNGVRAEEVKIDSLGIKLAGTLLIPKTLGGKRAPAILLVPGSDQGIQEKFRIAGAPRAAFRELAEYLAARGMVVLRYDSRCRVASQCKPSSSPQDSSEDVTAALTYLRRRAEVDPARIALIGHDEGGTFAASAAAASTTPKEKIAALVLLAAPGRGYSKLLRDQARKRLMEAGRSSNEINNYLAQVDRLNAHLSAGSSDFKKEEFDPKDPLLGPIINNPIYFFHISVDDPLQVIESVKVPVLIVQGEKDAYTTVRDAQYLAESLNRQYHDDMTLRILPEMDHWLRIQKGEARIEAGDDESRPLDPALLTLLTDWLAKRLK